MTLKKDKRKKEPHDRKKLAVLDAYDKSLGNVSVACQTAGISRQTFYMWKHEDEAFAERVNEIDESQIDFAETMLKKNIREGKETSLIFYLKTKGKERGYIEKSEQEITGKGGKSLIEPIIIEVIDNREKVDAEDTDY